MADIGVEVNRPAFLVAVRVAKPPDVSVGVQLVRPQVSVEVTQPGSTSGAQALVHTQSTPAATWVLPNTPTARAIVLAVYDDAGRVGYADVYVTVSNTSIVFPSPRTGRVDYIRG